MENRSNPYYFILTAVLLAGCAALLPTPAARPARADTPGHSPPALHGLIDARGAIELHSRHSHDGTTSIAEIARLAEVANLDFIFIADHNTLAGKPEERRSGQPLVLVGSELSTSAGHLLALFIEQEIPRDQPVETILEAIHAQGGLAIAAHPTWPKKPWTRWDLPLDGMEIFDFPTMLSAQAKSWVFLKTLALPNPVFWRTTLRRPKAALTLWDEQLAHRPLVGIAGHDTHAHAGIRPFIVDSYSSGFHAVTTHVWVEALNLKALYEGLRQRRCYVGFDGIADTRPFLFALSTPQGWALMGTQVRWQEGLTAVVELPRAARSVLYRNGAPMGEQSGHHAEWPVTQPGTYRVEVYLKNRLWILSNPIVLESSANAKGATGNK